jgi:hypothetical protein
VVPTGCVAKIAPIFVTALTLGSDQHAESWAKWSGEISAGVRRPQIPIVSFAFEDNEVARDIQHTVVVR